MLTPDQINFYHENGFLHIPDIFTPGQARAMREDLDWMIREWANIGVGWTGPWRRALMDIETEAASKLIAMHDLSFYSEPWARGTTRPGLARAMAELLTPEGGNADATPVELHHSTMHVKPPETGQPFPMHQDSAFYLHSDNRYCDVLVHLDDTCHANGEIRFLAGSHKHGHLDHITSFVNDRGETESCTPHLPTDRYSLKDTVPVPAKAGDIVVFNIFTIHGSYVNTTDQMRRMVRVGYKHPENTQLTGQSLGRPGLIVHGRRPRATGQTLFDTSRHDASALAKGDKAETDAFAIKL